MRLGLTMGGGGARGSAHIGVLLELERLGIHPALITGTSIGGLVGVLWASGLPAAEISNLLQRLGITQMYSLPREQPSLSGHKKIERFLEDAIGRPTFAELNLPVSVVATDLVSRQAVVLTQGDVIPAILATIAMPILLPPVAVGSWQLIDGGLVNNTPFDVARDQGASHVIAVDLTNSALYAPPYAPQQDVSFLSRLGQVVRKPQNEPLWQVATTIFDIVTEVPLQTRLDNAPPDLLIRPYVGTIGYLDFARWNDGVTAGRLAAQAVETELVGFARER